MMNKTTYLRLQCEFMETFYNDDKMLPINREIMRANAFCVKGSGKSIAYDDVVVAGRVMGTVDIAPRLATGYV
jgi:hypothetical protein